MREFRISVTPVAGGWTVRYDDGVEALMFLSGARAEQHARGLARRISENGSDAQVLVHDRTFALIGATRYAAAPQYELVAG